MLKWQLPLKNSHLQTLNWPIDLCKNQQTIVFQNPILVCLCDWLPRPVWNRILVSCNTFLFDCTVKRKLFWVTLSASPMSMLSNHFHYSIYIICFRNIILKILLYQHEFCCQNFNSISSCRLTSCKMSSFWRKICPMAWSIQMTQLLGSGVLLNHSNKFLMPLNWRWHHPRTPLGANTIRTPCFRDRQWVVNLPIKLV